MTMTMQGCPYCGSPNHRVLADHMGHVGWCRDCHRTWEPAQARLVAPVQQQRGGDLLSKRDRRFA
ncbi:MAG: hypothetical protein NVV74_04255 [Magnetospirillum sp.]|nr:hypothetical protein [Magnetospirillum sp.]